MVLVLSIREWFSMLVSQQDQSQGSSGLLTPLSSITEERITLLSLSLFNSPSKEPPEIRMFKKSLSRKQESTTQLN